MGQTSYYLTPKRLRYPTGIMNQELAGLFRSKLLKKKKNNFQDVLYWPLSKS